ncbi:collagen triple helix repeat-containing protein 1-like [Oscarella lobularis]|uniref:collagen triple helix repeat-containing protein 1-like n=1 Tax=Oscarella lobularis TaxID=121494 RepID=UPI00331394FA
MLSTVSFLLCVASLYLSAEVQAINYQQCTWNNYQSQQVGTVQTCTINKQSASSALKVTYAATMSVLCPGSLCCGKWYFTFNGNECTSPDTIEGIVHVNDNQNNPMSTSRHRQITGICENLPIGNVAVAVRVGNCPYYGTTSKHSGWGTVSRIIIEEY